MPKKSTPDKAAAERFGASIRKLRKRQYLTAQDVGNFVGLNGDTILKYERGEREPNFLTLILFSHLFGVSIDRLVGGGYEVFKPVSLSSPKQLKDVVVVRDEDGEVTYVGPDRRDKKLKKPFRGDDKRSKKIRR